MVYLGQAQCFKCTKNGVCPPKTVHLVKELLPVYRPKDRTSRPLFHELFPFVGKLDERNRGFRIAQLIPWQDLEDEYRKAFWKIRGYETIDVLYLRPSVVHVRL